MALWIGKNLGARLLTRLNLSQVGRPGNWPLAPVVQPVTLVDDFLAEVKQETFAVAGIGAVGYYPFMTVPAGKRRIVSAIQGGKATGTFTFSLFWIAAGDKQYDQGYNVRVKTFTPAASFFYYPSDRPFELMPGWRLGFYVDAHTGAGTATAEVLYREEDAE